MKTWFKENQNHLIIIGIFLLLVVFYFTPVWQGKTLLQSDVMQARGSQKEIFDICLITKEESPSLELVYPK